MSKRKKVCGSVPMIMQMEALECGAASLAMILAYHNKWVPLEQVREDCGVSRDGSLASNIVKAAQGYGLKVKACKKGMTAIRDKTSYPAVIHWNFNHFVVLRGFSGKYAYINDPAQGKVRIPIEEFSHSFTGVCIEFEPTEEFVPGGRPESVMKFAANRLRGSGAMVAFVMLTAALAALGSLAAPALSRFFTDQVLTASISPWISPLLTAVALLFVYQLAVGIFNAVYLVKIEGKLAITSNSSFMWHMLRMPMRFFSQRSTGDLANRQSLNDQVAQTLISKAAPLFINILLAVFYFVIMIRYSVVLALIGVAAAVLNLLTAQLISRLNIDLTRVRLRDESNLYSATVSGIDMIESIKAAGAENGYFERWAGFAASSGETEVREEHENRFLGQLPTLIQSLSDTFVLTTGVYMVMNGEFTAGMLIAFQGLLSRFLTPVNTLIESMQSFQEMRTSMERIDDVMSYKEDTSSIVEYDEDADYNKLTGEIEMKHVTFGYSRLAKPLLNDFSLTIHPGDKIAIVGMSGCGKSTIAKLLSGLYEPWAGEILYDGKRRSEIPKEVFCGSLLSVDQDITVFADTVGDNIRMWDDTIEDFEVILAARDAQIHDDIMQRQGGYDYMLSDGGKEFSGGQCQRFEIARVLAGDPSVIILDEATSALDAKTEYLVTQAVRERGITSIVIAHRLSTVRDSDLILVMEDGTVREQGTHDELMKMNGLYTQLITSA